MESHLDDYVQQVMPLEFKENNGHYSQDQERETSAQYKASVTPRKIRDLHRWGYRTAARMIPNNSQNRNALVDFIQFFDEFCSNNNAEDLDAEGYTGMIVSVYKEKGIISWTARLTHESGGSKLLKETDTIYL